MATAALRFAPSAPMRDPRDSPPSGRSQYLAPGQLLVCRDSTVISTIVGSCVAVCLSDPVAGIGGMNHFLLPLRVGLERSPRFGSVAIPGLIDRLLSEGARRDRLEAKVFGGASLVGSRARRDDPLGSKNARLAFDLLAEARIPVVAEDVEGPRGRKILYHTGDGTAWVRLI
jgi:chemotaxis protein CheD